MSRIKKINKRVKLESDNYINMDTGETLSSEISCNKERLRLDKETELITIESDEFIVIDSKAMAYISTILSPAEFKRVMCMANMLKTDFNIVFNHNIPHTPSTLSEELQLTIDDLTRLVKRLHKKGILSYFVSYKSGYLQKL
ncbi:MAG TPA: hypothetical protein PKD00_05685 [Burkholderiales bacterium]|nr:hypothetical protein [Burkholderiales bacterium]